MFFLFISYFDINQLLFLQPLVQDRVGQKSSLILTKEINKDPIKNKTQSHTQFPRSFICKVAARFQGLKKQLKPSQDLNLNMKQPESIVRPGRSLPKLDNPISLVVIEIIRFRKKILLLYILGFLNQHKSSKSFEKSSFVL